MSETKCLRQRLGGLHRAAVAVVAIAGAFGGTAMGDEPMAPEPAPDRAAVRNQTVPAPPQPIGPVDRIPPAAGVVPDPSRDTAPPPGDAKQQEGDPKDD